MPPTAEYREQPDNNEALKGPILELLLQAGLQDDCPFDPAATEPRALAAEDADGIGTEAFSEYASRVYQYLQVLCSTYSTLASSAGVLSTC